MLRRQDAGEVMWFYANTTLSLRQARKNCPSPDARRPSHCRRAGLITFQSGRQFLALSPDELAL